MKFSAKLESTLKTARSICVLTGAGISAESGVPTFRGNDGLWSKFKPEELANFQAFMKNPVLVWEWYTYRKKIMKEVSPNPAHFALVEMEKQYEDFTLVTQNVDNLHSRAGSRTVLELHGNIDRSYCVDCRREAFDIMLGEEGEVPRCEVCNGLIRPDVVWFGEMLPQETFRQAVLSARRSDLFLCIGTSGIVYPAASLPRCAKEEGSFVVEINPERTDLSPLVSETLLGKAGTIVPSIYEAMMQSRKTK